MPRRSWRTEEPCFGGLGRGTWRRVACSQPPTVDPGSGLPRWNPPLATSPVPKGTHHRGPTPLHFRRTVDTQDPAPPSLDDPDPLPRSLWVSYPGPSSRTSGKNTNPFMTAPPRSSRYLPKAPRPDTVTLTLALQQMAEGGTFNTLQ